MPELATHQATSLKHSFQKHSGETPWAASRSCQGLRLHRPDYIFTSTKLEKLATSAYFQDTGFPRRRRANQEVPSSAGGRPHSQTRLPHQDRWDTCEHILHQEASAIGGPRQYLYLKQQ